MSTLDIWFFFLAKEIGIRRKKIKFIFAIRQATLWVEDQVMRWPQCGMFSSIKLPVTITYILSIGITALEINAPCEKDSKFRELLSGRVLA